MDSGKRRRVMIACVTFETVKVTNPIQYYETPIIHLIHYVRNPGESSGKIYESFYQRVCEIISELGEDYHVIEHIQDVNDFQKMMKTIDVILTDEYAQFPNSDVFVNISAGSSEYVAAATINQMMFQDCIPFAVKTKKYTLSGEFDLEQQYFRNQLPIGLTEETFLPATVPKISILRPDESLVRGLKVLRDTYDSKPNARAGEIINNLKLNNVWCRQEDPDRKTSSSRYDLIYYHRDFVSKWVEQGWITKDQYRNIYRLTPEGNRVVDTFYTSKSGGF